MRGQGETTTVSVLNAAGRRSALNICNNLLQNQLLLAFSLAHGSTVTSSFSEILGEIQYNVYRFHCH
jgi:hypothetical protein